MSDDDIMVDGRPLSSLKVTELKEELENRRLSTKGVKAVLQERLKEALASGDSAVDEKNPVVAGYLARQTAALEEARKRTESEASGADTPQDQLSPSKVSPTKRNTPRRGQKTVEPAPEPIAETVPEPVQESIPEQVPVAEERGPEQVTKEEEKPSTEQSNISSNPESSNNGSTDASPVKKEVEVKEEVKTPVKVAPATPQKAKRVDAAEESKPVESKTELDEDKDKVIEKPVEKQLPKEDESDELDYGDDEEKEKEEEPMDAEDASEQLETEKSEEKVVIDEGVKKEEKVRGSVSHRRASSPSSRHPVSNIVHIRGLVRPFTERNLRAEIEKYGGEIVDFWIDKVKSHCFAKLKSEDDARNVLKSLHDKTWPEGNPKKLAIVYETEENMNRYKEGLGEVKLPEAVTIGTLTGGSRADRLSTASQPSVIGGKASLQITLQNVLRDNDKMDLERKEKRGSLASRLTRIDDKEKPKEEKEERKRVRSETPPFSRGAGFMDEKKAKHEEREKEKKRDEPRREDSRREDRRVEEEVPVKSLEQLFKKTVATPSIYYLPLTEEQIAAKAIKKERPSEGEKSAERPERAAARPERSSDRPERSERPERAERKDRPDRERADRADRGERDRGSRGERGDRGGDRDRPRRRD
ncbi:unnamed protein product [Caenorhabditis sp. 36 PRJEB53466]|nr:unnamed protein product [Caenorhabditis sp. 36 PRJEB53466]